MFKKRLKLSAGKNQTNYKNQIDDEEETAAGQGKQIQMARGGISADIKSTKAGTQFNYSADLGSARGSISLYRSDINSDYVINNAYGIQDDLEHVNLVQY